jgi:hypothetical protein
MRGPWMPGPRRQESAQRHGPGAGGGRRRRRRCRPRRAATVSPCPRRRAPVPRWSRCSRPAAAHIPGRRGGRPPTSDTPPRARLVRPGPARVSARPAPATRRARHRPPLEPAIARKPPVDLATSGPAPPRPASRTGPEDTKRVPVRSLDGYGCGSGWWDFVGKNCLGAEGPGHCSVMSQRIRETPDLHGRAKRSYES